MGFLRRLLGGERRSDAPEATAAAAPGAGPADVDAEEREYELELLRSEDERLGDLAKRQLRFAKYAWQPPAQGGERRADDQDTKGSGQ